MTRFSLRQYVICVCRHDIVAIVAGVVACLRLKELFSRMLHESRFELKIIKPAAVERELSREEEFFSSIFVAADVSAARDFAFNVSEDLKWISFPNALFSYMEFRISERARVCTFAEEINKLKQRRAAGATDTELHLAVVEPF